MLFVSKQETRWVRIYSVIYLCSETNSKCFSHCNFLEICSHLETSVNNKRILSFRFVWRLGPRLQDGEDVGKCLYFVFYITSPGRCTTLSTISRHFFTSSKWKQSSACHEQYLWYNFATSGLPTLSATF